MVIHLTHKRTIHCCIRLRLFSWHITASIVLKCSLSGARLNLEWPQKWRRVLNWNSNTRISFWRALLPYLRAHCCFSRKHVVVEMTWRWKPPVKYCCYITRTFFYISILRVVVNPSSSLLVVLRGVVRKIGLCFTGRFLFDPTTTHSDQLVSTEKYVRTNAPKCLILQVFFTAKCEWPKLSQIQYFVYTEIP